MEERTTDEIAAIYKAAGDSVTVIGVAKTEEETADEFKDRIKRNVEHLEIIKGYKKLDETHLSGHQNPSQLSTKQFVDGKKLY